MNQLTNHNAEDYNSSDIQDLLSLITPEQQKETDRKMKLALKIFNAMKAKGWNKSELAKEMNVNNSQVTRWLSGTQDISSTSLWQLGDKLGVVFLPVEEEAPKIEIRYRAVKVEKAANSDVATFGTDQIAKITAEYEPFAKDPDPYSRHAQFSMKDALLAEI